MTTPAKRKDSSPKLTADQVDKIKSANLANLVKKVRAGKTLTAAESKLLDQEIGDSAGKMLVTTSRLAEIFGINRKTIAEWRKTKREGVPEKVGAKEDLDSWRSWFAANPDAGFGDMKPRRDRETLLCEKLEVEIAIKKIELEVESGKFVSLESQLAAGMQMGMVIKGIFLKLSSDLAPVLAGRPAGEIKTALDKYAREKLTELSLYESPIKIAAD